MSHKSASEQISAANDAYLDILSSLMERFVKLVGAPAAVHVARRVPDLELDDDGNVLGYARDDPHGTVTALVDQFTTVFGDVGVSLAQQTARAIAKARGDDAWPPASPAPARAARGAPTRILLVDDHVLVREGLASLIDPEPDLQIVGQAGTLREAIVLARNLRPDMILMDFTLPDGTGEEAARLILSEAPATRIVFLTVHDDDGRLFAAIAAGAMGYLLKSVRSAELLTRLRGAARGEVALAPDTARRILDEFSRLPSVGAANPIQPAELTERENEIVRELADGASNREIAERLVISENTVKNHVHNVLTKLHLRNRHDLRDYARARGLHLSSAPRSSP